jgi:hypothetical protein
MGLVAEPAGNHVEESGGPIRARNAGDPYRPALDRMVRAGSGRSTANRAIRRLAAIGDDRSGSIVDQPTSRACRRPRLDRATPTEQGVGALFAAWAAACSSAVRRSSRPGRPAAGLGLGATAKPGTLAQLSSLDLLGRRRRSGRGRTGRAPRVWWASPADHHAIERSGEIAGQRLLEHQTVPTRAPSADGGRNPSSRSRPGCRRACAVADRAADRARAEVVEDHRSDVEDERLGRVRVDWTIA